MTPARVVSDLEIVESLARGRSAALTASRIHCAEQLVVEVGRKYGWPDLAKLASAAEELRAHPQPSTPPAAPAVAPRTFTPKPAPTTTEPSPVDGWAALLDNARKAGLGAHADRIETQLRDLADKISRQAELDKALRDLERAKAKVAQLRGTTTTGGGKADPQLAAIRAWAGENGHTVSAHGRIPKAVIDAYHAAQNGAGS